MPEHEIISIETPNGEVVQVAGLPEGQEYPLTLFTAVHHGREYGMRFCLATTPEGKFPVAFGFAEEEARIFDTDPDTAEVGAVGDWFLGHGCPHDVILALLAMCREECAARARKDGFLRN